MGKIIPGTEQQHEYYSLKQSLKYHVRQSAN